MAEPVTVLEHDPNSGCMGCPFYAADDVNGEWCNADGGPIPNGFKPAPQACPLRRGSVEVRRG